MQGHSIVLFDGVCNLCNGFVNFVIEHDPQGKFRFASLQSETGKALVKQFRLEDRKAESVILLEGGAAFTESTAALRIARSLKGGWKTFYALLIIPGFVRDRVYRFIAKNRYKWFGKSDSCLIPTPELRSRFLE